MSLPPPTPKQFTGRGWAEARVPVWLQAALIVCAGAWALGPALHGPWLWDDDQFITQNVALHSSAGFGQNWIAPTVPNYFPLTASVQWLQWRAWGENPLGYHATNIALHLLSALLLWRLLKKLDIALGWLGGLIFAVHPVVVESVAWISELKNTLSLPLLLLAMIAYVIYDQRWNALPPTRLSGSSVDPTRWGQRVPPYLASLLLFLAAMLSKSTVVMFPFILLLHAWWKRGKISRSDLKSSAPFFVVSLGLGLVTVGFEHHRAMIDVTSVPAGGLISRVGEAAVAIVFYFSKCLVPRHLALIYPFWPSSRLRPILCWSLLIAVFAWLWRKRTTWGRHALFGLGFFVLNLLPLLGIIPIAYQEISPVADHFVYLPLIGLIGLATAGLGGFYDLNGKAGKIGKGSDPSVFPSSPTFPFKSVFWALVLASVAALAMETHGYARVFSNADSLWAYTARQNPGSWIPENNLGLVLADAGRRPEAITHFARALQIKPDTAEVEANLGLALAGSGRLTEAIAHYNAALRLNPNFPEASNNLGLALARTNRTDEAIAQFDQAIRLRPGYPEAHRNLGLVLARSGHLPAAIAELQEAIRLNPDYGEAHNNLGLLLRAAGRSQEAAEQFEAAARLGPGPP